MRQTEKYVENQAYKFTYRKKGCQEYNAKVCICHNFFLDLQHEIERKMDQLNTLKKLYYLRSYTINPSVSQ